MKKILGIILCIFTFAVSAHGEVFTKEKKIIKYNLTLEKPVNVRLTFKFPASEKATSSSSWPYVLIYDEQGGGRLYGEKDNTVGYQFLKYRLDPNTQEAITVNAPLKAGNYKIYLSGNYYLNKPFEVSLTKVTGNFEQEPNNDKDSATQMTEKSFHYAYAGVRDGGKDRDFFQITMKEDGILDLVFKPTTVESCYGGYEVTLTGGVAIPERSGSTNDILMRGETTFDEFRRTIGLKKGEYFVKVYPNADCLKNKEYSLAYLAAPTQYTETEPNHDNNFTSPITVDGQQYKGRIQKRYGNGQDRDYFSFEISERQDVTLQFKAPNREDEYSVKIYDSKDKRVRYSRKKNRPITLAKGKYRIEISAIHYSNVKEDFKEYSLAIVPSENGTNFKF